MSTHREPNTQLEIDQQEADRQLLHRMGYAQELLRGMRTFQNFAISFSIICILAGGVNSFSQGLSSVGGAAIGIGWPFAALIALMFALAMGQIGSAYPTAGGLYHWGSILGGRAYGWFTAWANLFGLVTVLAAVNVSAYQFFLGAFGNSLHLDVAALTPAQPTLLSVGVQTAAVIAITCLQAVSNHLGIKLTTKLTDISGVLIFLTAVGLTVSLLLFSKHIEVSRLWQFQNLSGKAGGGVFPETHSLTYLFLLGLLLPAFTITGFDASAHTAEETIDAPNAIPKGMIHSVIWSGVIGWLMLAALVVSAPSVTEAASQGSGSFTWILQKVLPGPVVLIFVGLIFACQYLCGLATVTSLSRMVFAFARDGGLPFSPKLRHVSHRYRTPGVAIWVSSLLSVAFTVYAPVYTVLAAVCAMFVYLSYLMPVAAGLVAYRRTWNTFGPFQLGGWYRPVAVACVLGCGLFIYIGIQPPNEKTLEILVGSIVVTGLAWLLRERKRFAGPPLGKRIDEVQAKIAELEVEVSQPE